MSARNASLLLRRFSAPLSLLSPRFQVRPIPRHRRQAAEDPTCAGSELLSTTYISPLSSSSSTSSPRPIFAAPYVTSTTGTGLVHTSPAHGVEDWEAWRAFQSRLDPSKPLGDVLCAVDGTGRFSEVLGQMAEEGVRERLIGKEVLGDGTGAVIDLLREHGKLLKEVEVAHKYPYDWRTKKPVIFR